MCSRTTKVTVKQIGTTRNTDGVVDTISQNEYEAQHFLMSKTNVHHAAK